VTRVRPAGFAGTSQPAPILLANPPRALERVVRTGGMPTAVLPADAALAPA
jgi:hypothetical protein